MNCSRCRKAITEPVYISDNNGPSHPKCYYKAHPFKDKKTFNEVYSNMDDRVIVLELLNNVLTEGQKRLIVHTFNNIMQERWKATQK